MKVRELSERYSNPEEAFLNNNLAKLGDVLVNLIYSLGLSIAKGQADGDKISNLVLSKALSRANLRDLAPSRVDRHQLGDFVEAIIAYSWVHEIIGINEAAEILAEALEKTDFSDRKKVQKAAEQGFKNLLLEISDRESLEEN
ncbi:MAG: hypothetical protein KGY45_00960 [Hadesarchaea archaeon]|nr:hypothetical protein [Hadesarchaea archaeon]